MAEIKAMEHPTLKVPYEILNKRFRIAQKTLDRELSQIQNVASELEKGLSEGSASSEISRLLGGVVERLQVLKRKAEESISEELSAGYVCKRRLEHLKQNFSPPLDAATLELQAAATSQWKKIRLDRMIVEHFLRLGYYDTAERLADRSGIRDLTNIDIFQVTREVERDLVNRRTAKCIAWCNDNKSKLKKINSTIEFQLRVQEFVELIREDHRMLAVRHAQKYFPAFEHEQLKEIRQYMALLAFQVNTEVEPYRKLFDPQRWNDLVLHFRLENYRLFQLPSQSVLSVAVQAGISALKTPQCYSYTSKNMNCPVCQENVNEIAENLPFSHCAQSRLICRITGKPLNEHNLPMMLPNGQIFGQQAIEQMRRENDIIVCPKTNESFRAPKIEKVFVM
ncbi:erythroblast macrophage protein emp [Anopheles darlingi]|uniref:E3 ubiquitin-protein transferase MAEA n=1 Tax=Anopheles darlingi TaxID=43151 RepID=W5JGL4_ANODA|nr:E3 ubiquitin-protein transferase MAEA [Anopheles darlingi]XP_049534738.1 E3 ubiquitin-protein transferase MAEA [Anopheles darlingi]ETN63502.1 erythroblast macrophage protein emp [Anopheles darlingi]